MPPTIRIHAVAGLGQHRTEPPAGIRHSLGLAMRRDKVERPAIIGSELPMRASQSRIAFSSIASNTGARSPGEELMTCNTSAIACCCSSASRSLGQQPRFSIAMTA